LINFQKFAESSSVRPEASVVAVAASDEAAADAARTEFLRSSSCLARAAEAPDLRERRDLRAASLSADWIFVFCVVRLFFSRSALRLRKE